ncbi:MAG TPA: serine dehydratase subunit alpha family protein [Tissierellia bacterium]|nr:serine dehydratase subunit alpha family protein [Tissierellia bacterium]
MGCHCNYDYLLKIVKQDVFPALGCTEPVAVAFAAAVARGYLKGNLDNMLIQVSKNVYKNGRFVIIPNTNLYGLDIAGALGYLSGNPENGFLVFKDVDEVTIKAAHELIKSGRIKLEYLDESPDVYVHIAARDANDLVEVEIKDNHNHIERIMLNGEVVYEEKIDDVNCESIDYLKNMSFKEIREICESIPIEEFEFIQDGIEMNKKAAEIGIDGSIGLNIGHTLNRLVETGMLGNDAPTKARILTAAACDVRMGGGDYPIMTSGGSGNQGIGVVLPILVVAEERRIEKERLLRAIFLGHVINRYVKIYTGKLSGICGCAIAAGIGASAGISWMLGGDDDNISGACNNMLANLTGMICDGAKETCALKLAASASEAVISAYLSKENVTIRKNVGIIGNSIEETIRNVGMLTKEYFNKIDNGIITILNG